MLDAILAAPRTLVVTYTGANETTGQRAAARRTPRRAARRPRRHRRRRPRPRAASSTRCRPSTPATSQPPVPFSFDRAALAGSPGRRRRPRSRPRPWPTADLPPRPPADVELASLVDVLPAPGAGRSCATGSASPCSTRARRSPTGCRSSSTTSQQWGVGDRLLRDLLRGPHARRRPSPPSGGAASCRRVGSAGASANGSPTEAGAGGRDGRVGHPGAAARARVDVDVDLGGGRRLRGTVTDLYGDRVVIATFSRLGPRHWLEAWIPLLALCATHPGRSLVRRRDRPRREGSPRRARRGRRAGRVRRRRRRRRPAARPGGDLRRRHVRAAPAPAEAPPTPGPRGAGRATTSRSAADAEFKWLSQRFPGENDDAAHVARVGRRRAARRPARRAPRRARSATARTPGSAPSPCGSGSRCSSGASDELDDPTPFDILGPLPADASTTVLEASAGTGKTYTVGALVARYVAEGVATLDRDARDHLRPGREPGAPRAGPRPAGRRRAGPRRPRLGRPVRRAAHPPASSDDVPQRRKRITDALAGFDARHHRHHPPVLPAGAALARRRGRHRLARRAGREPRRPGGRGDRRPLPAAVRVDARGAAVRPRRRPPAGPGRGRRPPGRAGAARRRAGHRRRSPRRTSPSAVRARGGAPQASAAASSPTTTC